VWTARRRRTVLKTGLVTALTLTMIALAAFGIVALREFEVAPAANSGELTREIAPPADSMERVIEAETARLAAAGTPLCSHYGHAMARGRWPRRPRALLQQRGTIDGSEIWVAITCNGNQSPSPAGSQRLVVYEKRGAALATLLSEVGDSIGFVFPEFTDVNGDGETEIVVRARLERFFGFPYSDATGTGAMLYTEHGRYLRLLQVRDHVVSELPIELPIMPTVHVIVDSIDDGTRGALPKEVIDLNGDGVYELIAESFSWAKPPQDASDDSSARTSFVLAWDGEAYRDASSSFVHYFENEVATLETAAQTPDLEDWERMNVAVAMVLNLSRIGRTDLGWNKYRETVGAIKSPCWQQALPIIEYDLAVSLSSNADPTLMTPVPDCP
jgi:hypothetical protein